ncbi:low temperature requirement protein A [Streptomyces sp. WMMC500]|uniref:low temperature requirement protein A n=1 Tax=Streptomyces sp. WMMC500 TaxID=3015154 RepID=UPI00248BA1EB|nr:low temperature requirement protein A [Streptomyces sp. WMMC500]WBB59373.1 low temperature requirement protein A [Streptomyces sp. WMMC500]
MDAGNPYLRERAEDATAVTPVELFFDLVYVFAVTQISHLLLEDLNRHGAFHAALILLAMWQAWMYATWMTNWFDPRSLPVRAVLIGTMLVSLVAAAGVPGAFGDRGLWFAGSYVLMQVGRTLAVLWLSRRDRALRRTFQRITVWMAASAVLWIAGGYAAGGTRELVWLAAVVVDNTGPLVGFRVPVLGRSGTEDRAITGSHMAERCHLFVIIALGESILVTGATFAGHRPSATTLGALVIAFLGSVALWWIYFDRSARLGARAIGAAADPARIGRIGYTFLHIPMIAGIIVTAVGDELTIAGPRHPMTTATATAILLGPALFLAGHLLFHRTVSGFWVPSRLLALAALCLLIPVATVTEPLVLSFLAVLVVVAVAVSDTLHGRTRGTASAATQP